MQNNRVKKIRKRLFILLGISFIIFLAIFIIDSKIATDKAWTEVLPSTYSLTYEDSNIISEKYLGGLKAIEVRRSKVRNPISSMLLNNEYFLINYGIDLTNNEPLNTIIHTQLKRSLSSNWVVYSSIRNAGFNFQYKAGLISPVSKIYLTLFGDSLQTVKSNDSILSYHLLCENLSIKYSEEDPVDIYVKGDNKFLGMTGLIPLDLLFLKRDKSIYVLIMVPNNPENKIEPNLLYKIVTGS